MQDRPTVLELLDAVRRFLEHDVVPAFEGARQFHARVAANVLAIVERELRDDPRQLRDEWRRLTTLLARAPHPGPAVEPPADPEMLRAAVLALTTELSDRIRRGDADAGPFRDAVLAHAKATVMEKLRVANPRYLEGDS